MSKECRFCSVFITSQLSDIEHETLVNNCAHIAFKKGEMIFREGTLSSNVVYLKTGLAKLHMKGPTGEKILRLVKAPSYLGLPTSLGDKINQYSATAITEAQTCFISLETFSNSIERNGSFAYKVILELCKNELDDYRRYTNMSQKQVAGRLAEILLCMSHKLFESDRFELPLSINDLSDFVSSSRESVSRQLNEFNRDNIILMNKKEIVILREDLLRTISEKG